MKIRYVLTVLLILTTILYTGVKAQDVVLKFPALRGSYLGQKVPYIKPELFAEGIVSTPIGMHGNIVFSPNLKEACWHPDEPKGLYFSESKDGRWTKPYEISFVENYMHDAPCYSHDGKKLFFIAGNIGAQGKTENEKFYFIERTENGWSEPNRLPAVFDSFNIHWQFSLDQDDGLFFGGKIENSDEKGDIWYSKYKNGQYFMPEKLPSTVNTNEGEFSPCIAPDGSYLIFNRAIFPPQARPEFLLYVSFRTGEGSWTEAECLSDFLQGINARITPDGKYIFVIKSNGVFWVDAKVIYKMKLEN